MQESKYIRKFLEQSMDLDCLSLEYKLEYGCARGDLDIADVVNNPLCLSVGYVFRPSLKE